MYIGSCEGRKLRPLVRLEELFAPACPACATTVCLIAYEGSFDRCENKAGEEGLNRGRPVAACVPGRADHWSGRARECALSQRDGRSEPPLPAERARDASSARLAPGPRYDRSERRLQLAS